MNAHVAHLFQNARHIVFLTGAGISTPSGIPDYRSKNGLYRRHHGKRSAEWYLSYDCLMNHPRTFHHFVTKFMYHPQAKPNVIHKVQARLTRTGRATIITQNIDNLYHLAHANPQRLIEFHGNLYDCYCLKCHHQINWRRYVHDFVHHRDGGLIRPDVVLYGENISQKKFRRSMHVMLNADLIIIVGSAMKVEPFSDLIKYHQPNVPMIAVNQQPLRFSYQTGIHMIQENAVNFFKRLNQRLN